MIEAQNLVKHFEGQGGTHAVLDGIRLKAEDGEFVCILGPSGSGKSVFLYLLAGFLQPTSGQVLLNDEKIASPGLDRILLFQEHALFPWKTVLGNVLFGLKKVNIPKDQKKAIALKYIDLIGLAPYKDWYVHTLSGGMRQRVAFARALVSDPKVLLMDEPFAALDSQYRKHMRQSLEKIWQKTKKTILFVTHSVSEAVYLADTIYLFSNQPTTVQKTYKVSLPRPRDSRSEEFVKIVREIEGELTEGFEQMLAHRPEHNFAMDEIQLAL